MVQAQPMEGEGPARSYAAPRQLDEAVARLREAQGRARLLAGGTDLLVQMRSGRCQAEQIVDLKWIPELCRLELTGEELCIGAAAPAVLLGERPELRALWPGLVEAAGLIGSDQIQSRASLGGNLCNASPAADSVPALLVNEARCRIAGPEGQRMEPVEGFCRAPGQTGLGPAELLVSLHLPRPRPGSADAYQRFIPRSEMDIAVVGVAARIELDAAGRCSEARIALGAVAPTAIPVPEAAALLVGTRLGDAALEAAAGAARSACRPLDDLRGSAAFRRHLVGVLLRRVVRRAAQRAAQGMGGGG